MAIRSSCPLSERWASQEPHSCGSSLTSQIGSSGCLGGVRFLSHNYWGSSRLNAWTTYLLHLYVIIRIGHSKTWFFISLLSVISSWMKDHHLQLNLAKTELLVVSANPSLHHNLSIQLGSSTITPSRTARNPVVVIDDQLSFTDLIATMARSCRFALYNIRKIILFLSEQAAQLLVQALVHFRLDYYNTLLAGLPTCTIKPLQLIQNAAARSVFNELFIRLHWLPVAARIDIQGTDVCLQDNNWRCTNIPKLASANVCALQKLGFCKWTTPCGASQRDTKSLSRTFSWTVPSWRNHPISIQTAESLPIFKKHPKTHLFRQHLTN